MKRLIVVPIALFICGCAPTVSVTRFDSATHAGATTNVEVFTDRANVKRAYKEIGIIIADDNEAGAWGMSNEGSLIQKAIVQARSIGADAIILLPTESQQRNIGYGGAYNSVNRRIVRASAISYTK